MIFPDCYDGKYPLSGNEFSGYFISSINNLIINKISGLSLDF